MGRLLDIGHKKQVIVVLQNVAEVHISGWSNNTNNQLKRIGGDDANAPNVSRCASVKLIKKRVHSLLDRT